MYRREYQPNPVIVDRAVKLWVNALRKPEYKMHADGDRSAEAARSAAMLNWATEKQNENNQDEEVLKKFAVALKDILMNKQASSRNPDYIHYVDYLAVDYHPCEELEKAAEVAGLKMMFPIKTTMQLDEDYVSFSMGYGVQTSNHYPLKDGRFLVTTLRGSDISKIIDHYNTGNPLSLDVDTPVPE